MAYLIGVDQVKQVVSQPPSAHLSGFIGLVAFTGVFYWVFAVFREQACVAVCPYGRLQGVLLDKKSIAVMYDWLRGEPRGKLKKNTDQNNQGDCIDCKLCVHVCPTGIDIRNGTQLECVNCTACIDACDEVMEKINKPKGLIRYASYDAIKEGSQRLFTPRVAAYSVVLLALLSFLSFSLVTRSDVEMTVLKVPGQLYQKTEEGDIMNLYNIQFVNKTFDDMTLKVELLDNEFAQISKVGGGYVDVPSNGLSEGVFFIQIPKEKIEGTRTTLKVGVYLNGQLLETAKAKFLSPISAVKK